MKRRTLILPAIAAFAVVAAAATPAQEKAPADVNALELPAKVDELNRTLREIAEMLREQLEGQQVDQLIKRIEMQRKTMSPLEDDLREARAERQGISESIRELGAHAEFLEDQMNGEGQQAVNLDPSNYAGEKKRLELQVDLLQERLEAIDAKVYQLENELAIRRDEVRDWEDRLDEALGLR